jgi:predicted porin
MSFLRLSLACVLLLIGSRWAHGQPAAVQQLQNNQVGRELQSPVMDLTPGTNAPDLYAGENQDVGPQRILRVQPRVTWFDVVLDSQFFFSDNANFDVGPNAISSGVFVNTIQAAFMPPAVKLGEGKFAAAVGFSSQWYNYDDKRLGSLDFNAQTAFANSRYDLGNWQFNAGVNLTRLVDQSGYDETYRELMPNFGVQRILPVNNHMFFAVGELVDYHLTEVPSVLGSRTDINDRFDSITSGTFTWMVTRQIVVQPYYRFQYSYFEHDTLAVTHRDDYLHSFGVTAAYYFNKHLSLRLFYNYNWKQSDDQFTPAYHESNGGVGVSFDWKF